MQNDNIVINYEEILFMLKNKFVEVMEENYDYYKDYDLVIANEQEFVKNKDVDHHKIYIVISFGTTDVIYGQTALSLTLKIMSEENKLDVAQNLLTSFSTKYNLKWDEESMIYQVWQTPSINSNFNLVYAGFRSILTMSGMLLIGKNAIPNMLEFNYTDKGWDMINIITFSENFINQLDTQPYFNSENFTRSKAKFGTLSITITMYLVNDELITRALKIAYRKISNDTTFNIRIKHLPEKDFTDDLSFEDNFKLINLSTERVLDDFQIISLSFML